MRETVKTFQEIFAEEANNEKIQQLMYDICSCVEDVFRLKAIIASKHRVNITSDELLVILEKMLLTQRMLVKSVNAYFVTKHTHSNELKYLLSQFSATVPFSSRANLSAVPLSSFIKSEALQKDEESYLIIYINSHNEILIKSISLKLLDVLKYTKREMCDAELAKLLPAFFGELHNTAVIEQVTSTRRSLREIYSKVSFMLTKKRELIRIHFSATIFPSFEKAIYVINKITKLDLVDAEHNYQYYYMLTDENYNIVTMSPEFTCDFCLNYKMLKRYQINLPHLFSLNQDKLFKYFNTKKQSDNNHNVNNNTIINDTNAINSKMMLLNATTFNSTNTLESKAFTPVCPKAKHRFQSVYECVHKEVMALMLKKVLKKHQEHGVSQDEQKRLQAVINKLTQAQTPEMCARKSPSLVHARSPHVRKLSKDINNSNGIPCASNSNSEFIYLKLERRFLESQCYFIVRIRVCKKLLDNNKRRATHNLLQLDSISKISMIRNAGTYIGGNGCSGKNALFRKPKINVEMTASPGSRTSKCVKGITNFPSCFDGNGSQTSMVANTNNNNNNNSNQLQTIADTNEEDESSFQYKGIDLLMKKNHSAMVCSDFYVYGRNFGKNSNSGVSAAAGKKQRLIMRKQTFTTKVNDVVAQQKQLSEIESANAHASANEPSIADITLHNNDTADDVQMELIVLKQLNNEFKLHVRTASYIKIFQSGLYVILAVLCIVSFMSNKSNLYNSLSIFHLQGSSFFSTIFFLPFFSSITCSIGILTSTI